MFLVEYLSVCLSVCMFVIRELSKALFIFGLRVHLYGIQVKFIYEGHRLKVKVKVTRAVKCHPAAW